MNIKFSEISSQEIIWKNTNCSNTDMNADPEKAAINPEVVLIDKLLKYPFDIAGEMIF